MTDQASIQNMHIAIDQGLQKMGSFVYDNFLPEEIDLVINKMQRRFIKHRMFPDSDEYRKGFSANQKRLDDIRELITLNFEVSGGANANGTGSFGLPTDYLYLINLRTSVLVTGCSDEQYLATEIMELDEIYTKMKSPFFTKSMETTPVAVIAGNNIKVFQGKRSILKGVSLDYVRIPKEVSISLNQGCELAGHTHDEIVDLSIKHILEIIESPRYQSNSLENSQAE